MMRLQVVLASHVGDEAILPMDLCQGNQEEDCTRHVVFGLDIKDLITWDLVASLTCIVP